MVLADCSVLLTDGAGEDDNPAAGNKGQMEVIPKGLPLDTITVAIYSVVCGEVEVTEMCKSSKRDTTCGLAGGK